ncbi:RNA polymerase sigma factor FliA [Acidithiobacillus sp. IBUN Pt1247-S3]|uniref:RNA polymerase sigma factor FliA n=1 Tax=Acidithiobacillus sp. IBUN Pt1247-S3 TaxID=3166642 RepID=UPI0034E56228
MAGRIVDSATRSAQVAEYLPLVQRIAQRLRARLPPSVDLNDLVQAGLMGLLDALEQRENSINETAFQSYAAIRIRGAMLDELREQDWLPRRARQREQKIAKVMARLEQQLGRAATEEELAQDLGWTLSEYQEALREGGGQLLYLEDLSNENESFVAQHLRDTGEDLPGLLSAQYFQRDLVQAIAQLPEREQLVMALYYQEDLTLREIGKVLDLTESRVSQILRQAVLRLRSSLIDWREEA